MLRRYLAYRPGEVARVYCLLDSLAEGCPGHGLVHLLADIAAEIGFHWNSDRLGWERLGLPILSNSVGLVQHFRVAVLEAWRVRLLLIFVCVRGSVVARGRIFKVLCSSLTLTTFGLLKSVLIGGIWNGFLLGRVREQPVPCRLRGAADGDGHFFLEECTFRESPEFHDLLREDKAHWPRCLLWHGWLPMLSGVNGASLWAADASESAGYLVEAALGRYSSDLLAGWGLSDEYDEVEAASLMPDHPNVWTDGRLVLDRVTGVSSSGAGFFAHKSEDYWSGRRGAMLTVFVMIMLFSLAGVLAPFLGSAVCSES